MTFESNLSLTSDSITLWQVKSTVKRGNNLKKQKLKDFFKDFAAFPGKFSN